MFLDWLENMYEMTLFFLEFDEKTFFWAELMPFVIYPSHVLIALQQRAYFLSPYCVCVETLVI